MKWFWIKEQLVRQGALCKARWQLMRGLVKLSGLQGPIVSVFGGKGVGKESVYFEAAYKLSGQLVENGFSIITGGGPGIMSAANCGALDKAKSLGLNKIHTLGIGVHSVDVDFENPCANVFFTNYFFVRKRLLFRYSCGFVIFPGGIGTMDEFFEILNLIKVEKMKPVPIILFGTSYWKPMLTWYNQAVEQRFISTEYKSLFTVADSTDHVQIVIDAHCRK